MSKIIMILGAKEKAKDETNSLFEGRDKLL